MLPTAKSDQQQENLSVVIFGHV